MPAPTINSSGRQLANFIEHVRQSGVSKQSHYYVQLGVPPSIASSEVASSVGLFSLYVEQALLPEFVLATTLSKSNSVTTEFPVDKVFSPVTMTFLCDQGMEIKRFFDLWIKSSMISLGGVFNYYENFTLPELPIAILDDALTVRYVVVLYNAYPKLLNDVILASGSRDHNRFSVQFVYETWESFSFSANGEAVEAPEEVKQFIQNPTEQPLPGQDKVKQVTRANDPMQNSSPLLKDILNPTKKSPNSINSIPKTVGQGGKFGGGGANGSW